MFTFIIHSGFWSYLGQQTVTFLSNLISISIFCSTLFLRDLLVNAIKTGDANRFTWNIDILCLCLCLSLGASLVVVTQVACLAHANRVIQLISMLAIPGQLVSSKLSVAWRAHVFGIVLSVNMRALRNFHRITLVLLLVTFRNHLFLNSSGVWSFIQLLNHIFSFCYQFILIWKGGKVNFSLLVCLRLGWLFFFKEFLVEEIL